MNTQKTYLPHDRNKQLAFLIVSIVSVWILCSADWVVPIKNMYSDGFTVPLQNASDSQIIYDVLVLFCFPFVAYTASILFKASNLKWLSYPFFYLTATICVILHTSFYYYHHSLKIVTDPSVQAQLIAQYDKFKNPIGTIYFIGITIASLLLFIQVLRKRSPFPRWYAIFNPFAFWLILIVLKLILPTVADFLYPALIPACGLAIMYTIYLITLFVQENKRD